MLGAFFNALQRTKHARSDNPPTCSHAGAVGGFLVRVCACGVESPPLLDKGGRIRYEKLSLKNVRQLKNLVCYNELATHYERIFLFNGATTKKND